MAHAGVSPGSRKLRGTLAEHYRAGKASGHRAGPAQIGVGIGEGPRVHIQGQRRQTGTLTHLDRTDISIGRRVGNQGLRGSRAKYTEVTDGCQACTGGSQ